MNFFAMCIVFVFRKKNEIESYNSTLNCHIFNDIRKVEIILKNKH